MNTTRMNEFLRLDSQGLTARQIAERMNVDPRTVARWRAAAGRTTRTAYPPTPIKIREVAWRVITDGGSFQEAAATVGVTAVTIHRWFPAAQGWTRSQAGAHSVLVRRFNRLGRAA